MRPAIAATLLFASLVADADAQGVTTAGVRGRVTLEGGGLAQGISVRVFHKRMGTSIETMTRDGFFFVQGLEPGGPYSVTARRPGFAAETREVTIRLGELHDIEIVLRPAAVQLDSVTITASDLQASARAGGGTATTIDHRALAALPSLNRDFYEFVRLVPHVSTKLGLPNAGFSAGGVGFRFNNFLINGVSERSVSGNVSTAFSGARSMSLEAVQEYQVLLAPYDVRYGDFSGGLVNTVTKSGGNEVAGSIFAFARNDRIGRASASQGSYDRIQYGGSIGGPIIRDRIHFFVAPELQHFTSPAAGPYIGMSNPREPVPVAGSDIDRFTTIAQEYGLEPGSAGPVTNSSPLRNFFGRLDFAFPEANTRVSLWNNQVRSVDGLFMRSWRDTFALSSVRTNRRAGSSQIAVHAQTSLRRAGGGHNELLFSRFVQTLSSHSPVAQPLVRVSVPAASGGRITLNSGTHETAQGSPIQSRAFSVKDNLTLPVGGKHIVTLGAEAERFYSARGSLLNSYGTWSFDGLDAFESGTADRYEIALDLGVPNVPIRGWQYAAYTTDSWRVSPRFALTAGARVDLLTIDGRAPYHAGVDSIFGRRTDSRLSPSVGFSPRIGFAWNPGSENIHTIRGGAGLFTSRFPLAWAHTALTSHGAGTGVLRCGRSPADLGPPPPFNPDRLDAPVACANGAGISASRRGDVDLLSEDLRLMRTLRGSLAYDRVVVPGLMLTGEIMATRGMSEFMFVNLNLGDPLGTDRNGRVMYGTLSASGIASPLLRSNFSEVIDIVNISGSRSYQLSGRVEKTGRRFNGAASYTFSRVRDAVTPLRVNTRGLVAWASSRVVSGRHDDRSIGTSSNDIPHRLTFSGSLVVAPRWGTSLSFYYVGESGRPFTYVYSGTLRRGDLNADGTSTNDPVYVPLDAHDDTEIRFDGDDVAADVQRAAFESFIESTKCLRQQRGKILQRNSCREPWTNVTALSLRQPLPLSRRSVEMQADLYNPLNLLNSGWGIRREADPLLLEHVAHSGTSADAQPIVRYNASAARWITVHSESAFQFQLALRYRF